MGRHRRLRKAAAEHYIVHHIDLSASQRTWWEGIPITNLATTIDDCIDFGTPTYLIRQAIERGMKKNLLSAQAALDLQSRLDARDLGKVAS